MLTSKINFNVRDHSSLQSLRFVMCYSVHYPLNILRFLDVILGDGYCISELCAGLFYLETGNFQIKSEASVTSSSSSSSSTPFWTTLVIILVIIIKKTWQREEGEAGLQRHLYEEAQARWLDQFQGGP